MVLTGVLIVMAGSAGAPATAAPDGAAERGAVARAALDRGATDRAAQRVAEERGAAERSDVVDGATDGTGAPDPAAVATAARWLAVAEPGDLWAVAHAAALPLDGLWSPTQGAYVANSAYVAERFPRGRMNAEMLLLHAYAVAGWQSDESAHPERIEPLVRLLTGPMFVAAWDGKTTRRPQEGRSTTVHAPGFTDATRDPQTMHQSLDAVALRALAAAWRVRDRVGLSEETRALIVDRVRAVARSPYWRYPGRLLNQINWSADVYAADADVTGDPMLLVKDYRRQLLWFTQHARRSGYLRGAPNLTSGLGFHYAPQRSVTNSLNQTDTAEYASITLGALAYHDQALAAGMDPLPAADRTTLRRWLRRVAFGNWTTDGYLNWDSGKGVQRLHLTQYWVLALRGFATGLEGSKDGGFMTDQKATARATALAAIDRYRRRATAARSVILPAADYGFSGSSLVENGFDGLTGTARFAATAAELAARGLNVWAGRAVPLPDAYAHDASVGRLAITTSRYVSAFLRPWAPLRVGGLEPARLLDARGRPLTGMGGSEDGALGLRVTAGGATQVSTQPGRVRARQSSLRVPSGVRDHAGPLRGTLVARGTDAGYKVGLDLRHEIRGSTIRTTYRLRVDRSDPVQGVLRIPTSGRGRGSLRVGRTSSRAELLRPMTITAPSGGRFTVRLEGLPAGATGRVVRVRSQRGNPTPGPQLRITFPLSKGRTQISRTITVPPA